MTFNYVHFIKSETRLTVVPLLPEIRLHLADEATALWQKTEAELGNLNLPPPFWAFAWAGGQALARHLLDHPTLVAGKRVLDFASGCGLGAIAAAKAGARSVVANDIDPFALAAAKLNAAENNVTIETCAGDIIGIENDFDVILAGDIAYERDTAERVTNWLETLAQKGKEVLIGDPRRAYLATEKLEPFATYDVPVSRVLEDTDVKKAAVFRFRNAIA
jgi:predicted nicotinamide N-methyase